MSKFELGDYVMEIVTGLEGVVVARIEALGGAWSVFVHWNGTYQGRTVTEHPVDDPRLELLPRPRVVLGDKSTYPAFVIQRTIAEMVDKMGDRETRPAV